MRHRKSDEFRLARTEVTRAQWRAVMGNNPLKFKGCDECPVAEPSWKDAQKYLGKTAYCLPTEAEWEYAAAVGCSTPESPAGRSVSKASRRGGWAIAFGSSGQYNDLVDTACSPGKERHEQRDEGQSVIEKQRDQPVNEQDYRTLVAGLERQVRERTAALDAANKELEAFSYSVSHDLRAPLRAIDGFSGMLLEDHGDRLDAEGRRLLGVVRANAVKMTRLIDDLLTFSRTGRSDVQPQRVAMGEMTRSVFAEIVADPEGRARIDFAVGELPAAEGDTALVRQIWVNLLSNAVKFSSKRERAVIEVTARLEGDLVAYRVSDNGVGFDMQYAGKLFGVFQRLHTPAEFEGTGIGLALVQRIVARHGGRVWAEGEIGKGATFSFTLPASVA